MNNKRILRGQGIVEFALVLPVLLLLIVGIFEVGRMIYIYSAVTTATREAVRYGAAIGSDGGGDQFMDCHGIRMAARNLDPISGVRESYITINYDRGPGTAVYSACPPSSPDDVVGGTDRITVKISVIYQTINPVLTMPPITMESEATRTIIKDIALNP